MKGQAKHKSPRIDYGIVLSAVFLLAAFLLFLAGTRYAQELHEDTKVVNTFAVSGQGLTLAEVNRALAFNEQRNEGYSLVFWVQVNDVWIESEALSRPVELPVIYTKGNSGLLFPQANIAAMVDKACLISEGAAQVLDAQLSQDGFALKTLDATYTAIAVLPSEKPFLVVKAAADSEVLFNRLTIQASTSESFVITENTVQQSLGIRVHSLDYRVLSFLGFALLAATPLLLIALLIALAARAFDNKKRWLASRILTLSCVGFGLFALTAVIIGFLFEFSAYFPTRWSSSSEWAAVITEFRERFQILFNSAVALPDEFYYARFFAALIMGMLALLSLLVSGVFYSVSRIRSKAHHSSSSSSTPQVGLKGQSKQQRRALVKRDHIIPARYSVKR